MRKAKKILLTIIMVLLAIIFTYNVYNIYCLKILHKDLTTINGYALLEVVSGSMEPTIHVGDMIIIDTKVDEYKAGDIVTFYDSNKSFITHRIKEIHVDHIVTKGDNNESFDENDLKETDIVGKYVCRLNGAGKLLAAFKSPFTMVMIFVIGILACILVSTDKNGDPILDEDEKEFEEFLKYKKENEDKKELQSNTKSTTKKVSKNKETTKTTNKTKKSTNVNKNKNTKKTTTPKKKTSSSKAKKK